MTREEARREIDSLDFYLQNHTDDYSEESHMAMVMAIKALEQEPCDDTVSREAVKELFQEGSVMGMYYFLGIDNLPSVTPARKKGKWIVLKDECGDICEAICSCCGDNGNHRWKYCPNCGAEMDEEVEAIT